MNFKNSHNQARLGLGALGVAMALLLGGCAGLPGSTPEAAVEARANARWQALVKGDFDAAYEYLPPSVRATRTKQEYRGSFAGAVSWVKGEVERIECEAQRCEAVVRVEAVPLIRRGFTGNISLGIPESWIKEEGNWWFFPKP